jgi:hypothetical protein
MTDHHHSPGHSSADHSEEERSGRPQYDDVNTGVILMVGLISAIVTFLIIGFVQGLAYRWEAYFNQSRVEIVNQTVKAEVEAQKATLNSTNGPDGQPVAGRLTIEEAMKRAYEKFKQPSANDKTSNSGETVNSELQVASE